MIMKKSKRFINSILSIIILILLALISQNQEIKNYILNTTANVTEKNELALEIQESSERNQKDNNRYRRRR